jgi:hypothetical protein
MNKGLVGALVLLSLLSAVAAHATPWFTQDPRTLPEGMWRVEEHFMYSGIDSGLANGDTVPLPGGMTDVSALTLHTRVRYGARNDLTVLIDLPWVQKQVHSPAGSLDNDSLGDITLLAKYKYHEDKEAGKRRAVAGFVKLGTGDHEGVPPLLATGSGQNDYGLIHLWEWRQGASTTWYGNLGHVFRDTRSDTGVNPGDWTLFNLAVERKLGDKPLNLICELNGRHEAPSHQAGLSVPNTGSTILSLSPGLQYVDKKPKGRSITWEAGVQVPIVKEGGMPALPDYTVYAGGYAIF